MAEPTSRAAQPQGPTVVHAAHSYLLPTLRLPCLPPSFPCSQVAAALEAALKASKSAEATKVCLLLFFIVPFIGL